MYMKSSVENIRKSRLRIFSSQDSDMSFGASDLPSIHETSRLKDFDESLLLKSVNDVSYS